MRSSLPATTFVIVWALAAACNSDPSSPAYDPDIPAAWPPSVTNQWFVLAPGSVAIFKAVTPEGAESIRVEVLSTTRAVNGVTATVVLDQVSLDGSLIEETYDWYAQERNPVTSGIVLQCIQHSPGFERTPEVRPGLFYQARGTKGFVFARKQRREESSISSQGLSFSHFYQKGGEPPNFRIFGGVFFHHLIHRGHTR